MAWVSAREALKAVGGSPTEIFRIPQHDLIYDHARDGLVQSRARVFVCALPEGDEREKDAVVPDEFWAVDTHVGFESNWQSGQFVAKRSRDDPALQWRALGVEFSREDIEALGGNFSSPIKEIKTNPAGRKPELDRWQSFYFSVIEMAQGGRLNKAVLPSQKALWDDIEAYMGDGAWDYAYAKKFVAQIYRKFVDSR